MAHGTSTAVSPSESLATAVLLVATGAGWLILSMRPASVITAFGPICGHVGLLQPHCASCYAAAVLVALGVALGARAIRPATQRLAKTAAGASETPNQA